MHTIYDLITIILFAGLVILFLQRSTMPESPNDRIVYYVPPAVGCAVANFLGNEHQDAFAVGAILAVVVYVAYVLKPFKREP